MKTSHIEVVSNNRELLVKHFLPSKVESAALLWEPRGYTLWDYSYEIKETTGGQPTKKFYMLIEVSFLDKGEKGPKVGFFSKFGQKRRIADIRALFSKQIDEKTKEMLRADR